jgi:hypothetical protein
MDGNLASLVVKLHRLVLSSISRYIFVDVQAQRVDNWVFMSQEL